MHLNVLKMFSLATFIKNTSQPFVNFMINESEGIKLKKKEKNKAISTAESAFVYEFFLKLFCLNVCSWY